MGRLAMPLNQMLERRMLRATQITKEVPMKMRLPRHSFPCSTKTLTLKNLKIMMIVVVVALTQGKEKNIDLSKMTPEERVLLRRKVSSTRIFTTAEFVKMRKLVDREDRARHNPRAAARLKRLKAKGIEFEQLSGDESNDDNHELDSSDSEDDEINVKGVVNPFEIMANSKKKRENKMERLEKIVSGRDQFEFKQRAGGSTNKEKVRKKNFQMTKFSYENRKKSGSKETARQIKQMRGGRGVDKRDNRKRRRKT